MFIEKVKRTKQNRANACDIYNLFVDVSIKRKRNTNPVYRRVLWIESINILGEVSTNTLIKKSYAYGYYDRIDDVDYFELTENGVNWLTKEIRKWIGNHPNRINEVKNLPE